MIEGILIALGVVLVLSPCIHATWFDHRSSNEQNDDTKTKDDGNNDEVNKNELNERNDCEVSMGELLSAILKSELIVVVIIMLVGVGFVIATMYFMTINDSEKTMNCMSVAFACIFSVLITNKLGLWGSRRVSLSELLKNKKEE